MAELVWPSYDGGGIVNVPATIMRHFSSVQRTPAPLEIMAPPLWPHQHVDLDEDVHILLCFNIDAFGYDQVETQLRSGNMPHLQRLLDRGATLKPITSVFPPSTAPANFSLSTGLTPAQHGAVGYTIWMPSEAAVVNMIGMRHAGAGPVLVHADHVAQGRTIFEHLSDLGVSSYVVSLGAFARTALTGLLYRGATYVSVVPSGFGVRLDAIVDDLLARHQFGYVLVYWPYIDTVAHETGTGSHEYAAEANLVDHLFFGWLERRSFGGRVLMFVLADHGQVSLDQRKATLLNDHARIVGLLARPPAGEHRAVYLKAAEGRVEELRRILLEEFADIVDIMDVAAAIQKGLFGPLVSSSNAIPFHLELGDRLGDLILLPTEEDVQVNWAHRAGERERVFAGGHSGLTSAEMRVPLLSVRL